MSIMDITHQLSGSLSALDEIFLFPDGYVL